MIINDNIIINYEKKYNKLSLYSMKLVELCTHHSKYPSCRQQWQTGHFA